LALPKYLNNTLTILWGIKVSDPTHNKVFWQQKSLSEMTKQEWESLCDGCGRCCLNKLEDEDTGEIAWTDVVCKLLDTNNCRCGDYVNRQVRVPDCIPLSADNIDDISWLPPTCGYRLINENQALYWWHPLVSGDPETVHQAGISVRGKVVSEEDHPVSEFEDRLVDWPLEFPEGSQ
jgi:hypothetical protein